jgi:hypothetical protein
MALCGLLSRHLSCTALAPSPHASGFISTLVSRQYLIITILVNYAVRFSGPRTWVTALRCPEIAPSRVY